MDVSTLSISNMERGKHFPSAKNLNKLITIFELQNQLELLSLFLTSDSEKQKYCLKTDLKHLLPDFLFYLLSDILELIFLLVFVLPVSLQPLQFPKHSELLI